MIMDSVKNWRWIIPFKKFGMVIKGYYIYDSQLAMSYSDCILIAWISWEFVLKYILSLKNTLSVILSYYVMELWPLCYICSVTGHFKVHQLQWQLSLLPVKSNTFKKSLNVIYGAFFFIWNLNYYFSNTVKPTFINLPEIIIEMVIFVDWSSLKIKVDWLSLKLF